MRNAKRFAVLLTFALVAGCAAVHSREARVVPRPQVTLVSSFHLANNNRDLINLPIEDVLGPRRQEEIEHLVENLTRWRPTKIVLEWARSD